MGINVGKFVDRATGGAIQQRHVNNAVNSYTQLATGGLIGYNPDNGGWQTGIVPNALGINKSELSKNGAGDNVGNSMNPITQPAYQSQLDSPTYQTMRGQFASGSASPWANIAIARQGKLAEDQKQDLAQKNAGQTAQSLDKLATVGGLTSGARERTVQAGQQNYMTGVQDIGQAYGQNVMNIGIDDAQAKLGLGKGLMTAEMADLSGRNQYNQNKYQTDMQTWAAKEQANATRAAGGGGGGCFITTAVCDYAGLPDDCAFLNTFRKFRDEHMGGKDSETLKQYYAEAPAIVEKVNAHAEKDNIWAVVLELYLVPAFFFIMKNQIEEAKEVYTQMFNYLKKLEA